VRRWRALLDEYDERMMVAEAWVAAERRPLYLRPDEYHQAFDFDLLSATWDATTVPLDHRRQHPQCGRRRLERHVGAVEPRRRATPHEVRPAERRRPGSGCSTVPTTLLDAERGARRARAAALLTFALPGSVYVYQGDELGLPEAWHLPFEVLQDPIWEDSGHTKKGRDGCRVPIPWEPTGPSLGFGDAKGWLPQPEEFARLAASVQADDPTSTLNLYREALGIRRERVRAAGGVEIRADWIDLGSDVVAFERSDGLRCVVNMGDDAIALPAGDVVLASSPIDGTLLPPDTAVWLT
jgi:alpha-glucosidase